MQDPLFSKAAKISYFFHIDHLLKGGTAHHQYLSNV